MKYFLFITVFVSIFTSCGLLLFVLHNIVHDKQTSIGLNAVFLTGVFCNFVYCGKLLAKHFDNEKNRI